MFEPLEGTRVRHEMRYCRDRELGVHKRVLSHEIAKKSRRRTWNCFARERATGIPCSKGVYRAEVSDHGLRNPSARLMTIKVLRSESP